MTKEGIVVDHFMGMTSPLPINVCERPDFVQELGDAECGGDRHAARTIHDDLDRVSIRGFHLLNVGLGKQPFATGIARKLCYKLRGWHDVAVGQCLEIDDPLFEDGFEPRHAWRELVVPAPELADGVLGARQGSPCNRPIATAVI